MDTGNVPPPHPQSLQPPPDSDSGVKSIIPYKNGPALTAYYLAFLGLFTVVVPFLAIAEIIAATGLIVGGVLGFLFAVGVIVLGIMGVKRAKANPEAKGKVHAIVAIVGGSFEVLVTLGTIVLGVVWMLEN